MNLARRSRALALALVMATAGTVVPADAQETSRYLGRSLSEALQRLQAEGVPVVFSSAVVSPDLRVVAEPRALTPRQRLDELLAAHGLVVRSGPGGTLRVVRAAAPVKSRPLVTVAPITGRVVDASTNGGLAHVVVRLDVDRIETWTNDTGDFLFERVPVGLRTLSVSAPGYTSAQHLVALDGRTPVTVTLGLSSEPRRHQEFVSVVDAVPTRADRGVGSEISLDRSDLARVFGGIGDDPVRAVQALPRVVVPDDVRSEFSVRGSPFRHVALVIDGVSADWLLHSVPGRSSGSLSMFSGQVLERATLKTGAYPRRHGDALSAELELTLREGSRTKRRLQGGIGDAHALFIGEGPLGPVDQTGVARGSWLLAGRQSVREFPPKLSGSSKTPFGFVDGVARVVLDVGRSHQLGLTALGGASGADADEEDALAPTEPDSGTRRASVVAVSWRATLQPTLVVKQQVSWAAQQAWSPDEEGIGARTAGRALSYRADLTRTMTRGVLDAGVQIKRLDATWRGPDARATNGSSWLRSGFAHFAWPATRSLTIAPGVRITSSSATREPALSHWLLGEWSPRSAWSVTASAGVSRQLPEFDHVSGDAGVFAVRPERATHFELGFERRGSNSLRWQATVFTRREDDILRNLEIHPRLVEGALVFPTAERPVNGLRGASGGIELIIERRHPRGLSGWAAYSYAETKQTDPERGDVYSSDFDQRHTFNAFGAFRTTPGFGVSATFRAGSNVPVPAYLAERDGRWIVGDRRNQLRLPTYARLDLRADQSASYLGRRWTLFVESLNLLNRANIGAAAGWVDPMTGEARGFTDRLLGRRLSAGVLVDF